MNEIEPLCKYVNERHTDIQCNGELVVKYIMMKTRNLPHRENGGPSQ